MNIIFKKIRLKLTSLHLRREVCWSFVSLIKIELEITTKHLNVLKAVNLVQLPLEHLLLLTFKLDDVGENKVH